MDDTRRLAAELLAGDFGLRVPDATAATLSATRTRILAKFLELPCENSPGLSDYFAVQETAP